MYYKNFFGKVTPFYEGDSKKNVKTGKFLLGGMGWVRSRKRPGDKGVGAGI